MQFSSILLAAAAFALSNAAQFTNTAASFDGITVGKAVNLTWDDASGPVTLILKNGDPSDLQTVSTIASGLTTTSYLWTPASSLANGEYAFEIEDSTGPNYSIQFALTGGSASSSTISSASSASSASTTSSASTLSTTASTTTTRSSNSTISASSTKSATKASTTASSSSTSTSTSTPNSNSATSFASPLAFVFLAFAAMMTLN